MCGVGRGRMAANKMKKLGKGNAAECPRWDGCDHGAGGKEELTRRHRS